MPEDAGLKVLGWFMGITFGLFIAYAIFFSIPNSIAFKEKCEAAGGGVVKSQCVPVIELD